MADPNLKETTPAALTPEQREHVIRFAWGADPETIEPENRAAAMDIQFLLAELSRVRTERDEAREALREAEASFAEVENAASAFLNRATEAEALLDKAVVRLTDAEGLVVRQREALERIERLGTTALTSAEAAHRSVTHAETGVLVGIAREVLSLPHTPEAVGLCGRPYDLTGCSYPEGHDGPHSWAASGVAHTPEDKE